MSDREVWIWISHINYFLYMDFKLHCWFKWTAYTEKSERIHLRTCSWEQCKCTFKQVTLESLIVSGWYYQWSLDYDFSHLRVDVYLWSETILRIHWLYWLHFHWVWWEMASPHIDTSTGYVESEERNFILTSQLRDRILVSLLYQRMGIWDE